MADTEILFVGADGSNVHIKAIDNGDGTFSSAVGAVGPMQADVSMDIAVPTSYNVTLTLANTEYSQALPANCKGFEFQARTEVDVRFAFVTGKVAGPTAPYNTLKAGDYYFSGPINQEATPSTLYLASATAGTVVELIVWL
jgi:hypothetical protein